MFVLNLERAGLILMTIFIVVQVQVVVGRFWVCQISTKSTSFSLFNSLRRHFCFCLHSCRMPSKFKSRLKSLNQNKQLIVNSLEFVWEQILYYTDKGNIMCGEWGEIERGRGSERVD